MSIEETWGNVNSHEDKDLSSILNKNNLRELPSNNPLLKIKRNLAYNIFWAVLVCCGYPFIIFFIHAWQVQLAIVVTLVFSLWSVYAACVQYKKLDARVDGHSSLLQEMKRHHQSIQSWMKTQLQASLFIYPVSAAGGFLLGGILGSGKTVAQFINKPFVQVWLLIAIVVIVPAAYFLARLLFKMSFGRYLDALEKNIRALELEN